MLLLQVASPKACQRLTILIVYSLISLRAAPKSLNFMLGGLPRQGHTTSDLSGVLPPRLSDANLRRALQHAGLLGAPLFSSPDDMSRALCCHAAVIIFHLSLNVTSFNVCSRFHLLRLSRQYVRTMCTQHVGALRALVQDIQRPKLPADLQPQITPVQDP